MTSATGLNLVPEVGHFGRALMGHFWRAAKIIRMFRSQRWSGCNSGGYCLRNMVLHFLLGPRFLVLASGNSRRSPVWITGILVPAWRNFGPRRGRARLIRRRTAIQHCHRLAINGGYPGVIAPRRPTQRPPSLLDRTDFHPRSVRANPSELRYWGQTTGDPRRWDSTILRGIGRVRKTSR